MKKQMCVETAFSNGRETTLFPEKEPEAAILVARKGQIVDPSVLERFENSVDFFRDATKEELRPVPIGGSVSISRASEEPDEEEESAMDSMTVKELKEYADEKGIDLAGASLKADIISAIRDAEKE